MRRPGNLKRKKRTFEVFQLLFPGIEKIISKEEAEEKAREQLSSHGPIHVFNRFGGGANEGERSLV